MIRSDTLPVIRCWKQSHAGCNPASAEMTSSHPLMGTNTVPQMLTLLARHERRHQGQMERVRVDARFPAR